MDLINVVYLNLCILCTFVAFCIAIEQTVLIEKNGSFENSFEILSTHLTGLESQDFCAAKDIVLIAGNVQTCKITLISHLTDPNLTVEDTNVHVDTRINFHDDDNHVDKPNRSKQSSGANLCNSIDIIIPRHTNDQTNSIDYYNFPGFGTHQTLERDIIAMASVKKLMDCSKQQQQQRRMKFVFTMNLPPNRLFEVSRTDFLSLAENAITFVKNITKYRNSIMLVVTEFQDFYTNTDGQYQFIDDHSMIARVATFLLRIKHSLESTNHLYSEHGKMKIIEFIDILLEKQENEFMKIGISRLQLHYSVARNLELLNDEKQRIISILNYRLKYVDASPTDFYTAIPIETENLIRQRINEIQNHVIHDIDAIDSAIKEFYALEELIDVSEFDVFALDNTISTAILKISTKIRPDHPRAFKEQLVSVMNELKINIPKHHIEQFTKHIDYIDLLKNVTNIENLHFFISTAPLKNTVKYLNDMRKWYSFIIKLSTAMDQYQIQQQISLSDVAELLGKCSTFGKNNSAIKVNINEIGLSEFVEKIGSNTYHMVANMMVNGNMLNALKIAVGCAFNPFM